MYITHTDYYTNYSRDYAILTRELITTAGHIDGNLTSAATTGASSFDDTLPLALFFVFLNHQTLITP